MGAVGQGSGIATRLGGKDQMRASFKLQEAKKEDMRVIWEVVGDVELVRELGNENFMKQNGDALWRRLVQVMDMSEDDQVRDIEKV